MSSFLNDFHSLADGQIQVRPEQASRFAKLIADDFNPIHDPESKRFCVPGDLLFALVLAHCGLSEHMRFNFQGMVGRDAPLCLRESGDAHIDVTDGADKVYLQVERDGATTHDAAVIESLTRQYVAFSGHNFPHLLQPLLAEQGVMFNPDRPLLIYDSMDFTLQRLDISAPELALAEAKLAVNGKRGEVLLRYDIRAGGEVVGSGSKKLLVSGLRDYDDERMQAIIVQYAERKAAWQG